VCVCVEGGRKGRREGGRREGGTEGRREGGGGEKEGGEGRREGMRKEGRKERKVRGTDGRGRGEDGYSWYVGRERKWIIMVIVCREGGERIVLIIKRQVRECVNIEFLINFDFGELRGSWGVATCACSRKPYWGLSEIQRPLSSYAILMFLYQHRGFLSLLTAV